MNLFKGRWQTGLYTHTLFKSFVCLRNSNGTKHGPGHWTNKADLLGGMRYTHKQQRGRCRLAAILSFPLLKTTHLYLSIYTGIQVTFAYFSMSESLLHAELASHNLPRPKGEARLLENEAGMSLTGNICFLSLCKESNFHFHHCYAHYIFVDGWWMSEGDTLNASSIYLLKTDPALQQVTTLNGSISGVFLRAFRT